MKENELASMIGEDASMMGIYTDKKAVTAFEDSFIDESYDVPLKKLQEMTTLLKILRT